jgi:hypothetical protein
MAKKFMEATGVYVGVLQEDMVETVKSVKMPYCDILISDLYTANTDYPLTYVPMWNMILPLKKGDKVYVKFSQDNAMYPVLYKPYSAFESGVYSDYTLPSNGDLVIFPASVETASVVKITDDYYLISTDSYTVLHSSGCVYLISSSGQILYATKLQFLAGTVNVEATTAAEILAKKYTLTVNGDMSLQSTGDATLGSSSGATSITGASVAIPSAVLSTGGFCSILVCPMTGITHVTNQVGS